MVSLDELLREADPERASAPPDPARVDAALAALLRRVESAPARSTARRRWIPALTVVTVAAAVTVVVMVTGGRPEGVGNAWAKRVIARATVAALGVPGSALHADVTVSIRQPLARVSYQREHLVYWQRGQRQQMSANLIVPRRSSPHEDVIDGRLVEGYDQRRNVIRVSRLARGGSETDNPLSLALEAVPVPHEGVTTGNLRQAIVRLMRAPGVRVTRTRLDGTTAIELSGHDVGSFQIYLQPRSYAPLEFRRLTPIAGRSPHTTDQTLILRFNAYRTVAAAHLSPNLFNLRRQHPTARIVQGP